MKSFFCMFNTKFFVLIFFVLSFTNLSAQTVDSDGDGIANNIDLDDDNDGILDTVEDVCGSKTEGPPVYSNTFGTGTTTGSDPNILLHTLATGDPQDGSYIVTTSGVRTATYTKTNLPVTSDKDAGYNVITSGDTNGRYLMINVGSAASLNQAIYRISNLAVIVGRNYRFRIDMAGLADGLTDIPSLQLTIRDAGNNSVLATANSNSIGMANDDVWRRLSMEFVATSTAVTLEIVNLQGNGGNGNDVGLDNIVFTPYSCDVDADGIPNSLDTDSDGDGCPDAAEGTANITSSQLNANNQISGPVNSNGVPTAVGNGQGLGVSQNAALNKCSDFDLDGIANTADLDDDNDGILDCVENGLATASFLNNFTFVANNNATGVSANIAQLTPNLGTQSGQYWSVGKIDFTKSFSFSFDAFLGEFDAGADGIAIVFQNSPNGTAAVGATGGGMGALGIANGLVLELDTYDNTSSVGDIAADHGQIWDSDNQGTGLTTAVDLGQLENNAYHAVTVTWNAATQTISYTVDGITAGTLTTANFAITYFGTTKVRFGFTASTGGSTNVHRIRINDFCSTSIELDSDNDGVSNHLDLDSDADGCFDAVEGSENVTYSMVNPSTAANPGQINVRFNGTTTGTPSQIISTATAANGVPQVVNNSANNTNASIGLSGTAGVADNTGTSPVAGVGQAIGNSQNSALNDCKCYRNPTTTLGTDNATMHGITAFNRAGADNTNWPMIRNNGWTALEANTKAFVMNRMPVAITTVGTTVIAGEPVNASNVPVISTPVIGMTFYDTTNNCMKVNVDGTRTGWKCFNTQSCPEEN